MQAAKSCKCCAKVQLHRAKPDGTMPGHFRVMWAYDADGGGANVYASDVWDARGTWCGAWWTPAKSDEVLFASSYHFVGWTFCPANEEVVLTPLEQRLRFPAWESLGYKGYKRRGKGTTGRYVYTERANGGGYHAWEE